MRWFSSFAILVYLSLLCSPQALAVHDSRLSPLADTQLQGLNPAISSTLNQQALLADNAADDEPKAALPAANNSCADVLFPAAPVVTCDIATFARNGHPARAPPVLPSP